jgi:hypothetical protein
MDRWLTTKAFEPNHHFYQLIPFEPLNLIPKNHVHKRQIPIEPNAFLIMPQIDIVNSLAKQNYTINNLFHEQTSTTIMQLESLYVQHIDTKYISFPLNV